MNRCLHHIDLLRAGFTLVPLHLPKSLSGRGFAPGRWKSSWVSYKKSTIGPSVEIMRKKILIKPKYLDQICTSNKAWLPQKATSTSLLERLVNAEGTTDTAAVVSDCDLSSVLQVLVSLPDEDGRKQNGFARLDKLASLWASRDQISLKKMLYIADVFHVSGHESNYLQTMIQTIDYNFFMYSFEPKDIIQLLFYIAATRNAPVVLMCNLEDYIGEHLDEFTGNELGLVCFAFFSTNTTFFKYHVLEKIAKKSLTSLSKRDLDIDMATNVMKALRHARFENVKYYEQLGNIIVNLTSQQCDVKLNTLMHFAHIFASCGVTHKRFFGALGDQVCTILEDKMKTIRIKELVKIVWAYQTLHHSCPVVITKQLQDRLNKDKAMLSRTFPEAFVEGLVALAMAGIYPTHCIELALSESFVSKKSERQLEQNFQLLLLDEGVRIEHEDHPSTRLTEDVTRKLSQGFRRELRHELSVRQGLVPMLQALANTIGTPLAVKCHFVLKHSMIADIELQLNEHGHVLPLEQGNGWQDNVPEVTREGLPPPGSVTYEILEGKSLHSLNRGDIENMHLMPLQTESKCRRLLVKVLGWNQFALNSPTLLGIHVMELRLLQKLGYEIITICPTDAAALDAMSDAERTRYVEDNILQKFKINLTTT